MAAIELCKPRSIAWNRPWNIRKSEYARKKPDGGFVFISAMALMRAWWAYRQKIVRQFDLRVWFACFEAVARRCGTPENRFPRYAKEEIHRLVGGRDPARISAALRRLSKADLVEWSQDSIRFPRFTPDAADGPGHDLQSMIDLVENHRRRVPVPRRTLRFLARMSQPVLMATVLGHLLRCMYYRNGMCCPYGRSKASWIASVFGVDGRNVKAARKRLRDMGWLTVEPSSQTALNRWGPVACINLAWRDGRPQRSESPPRTLIRPRQSPPPRENKELSSRMKNQNPAFTERSGVRSKGTPTLRNVKAVDLCHTDRIDLLWRQAQAARLVGGAEADRLRVHAAAAHALRVGTRNPPGLFVTIMRRGMWAYLSNEDEDSARQRIVKRCQCDDGGWVDSSRATAVIPQPARSILVGLSTSLLNLRLLSTSRICDPGLL